MVFRELISFDKTFQEYFMLYVLITQIRDDILIRLQFQELFTV